MGPDLLLSSGGGTSIAHGGSAIATFTRFGSRGSHFLLHPRAWWCWKGRQRRRNSYKISIVS